MSTSGSHSPTGRPVTKVTGPEAEEVKALTDQFFATLRSYAVALPAQQPVPEGLQRLRDLLDRQRCWSEAYEVEQLLTHFYDPSTLQMELERRVLESHTLLPEDQKDWYADHFKQAKDVAAQRALLLRLLNDLQWQYTISEAKRGYSKQITKRTSILLSVAIAAVFLTAVFMLGGKSGDSSHPPGLSLVLAVFAGAWGAAFSMMIGLRDRLQASSFDELKASRAWPLLIARNLIGVGAALILYFFVQAGMLGGSVFPKIGEDSAMSGTDMALLVVWCFVAGFSEKLVPHLLTRTEESATSDGGSQITGNPRPSLAASMSTESAPVSPPIRETPPPAQ